MEEAARIDIGTGARAVSRVEEGRVLGAASLGHTARSNL